MADDLRLDAVVDVRWAKISDDGLYRYELGRRWDDSGRRLVWIMLNPSTADAALDDQTIRACRYFSRREGYGELVVVNLYAYRATHPNELRQVEDPDGPENLRYLDRHLVDAESVAVAWGANPLARGRDGLVLDARPDLLCLGRTADGSPRHPSRLPHSARFEPYPPPRAATLVP